MQKQKSALCFQPLSTLASLPSGDVSAKKTGSVALTLKFTLGFARCNRNPCQVRSEATSEKGSWASTIVSAITSWNFSRIRIWTHHSTSFVGSAHCASKSPRTLAPDLGVTGYRRSWPLCCGHQLWLQESIHYLSDCRVILRTIGNDLRKSKRNNSDPHALAGGYPYKSCNPLTREACGCRWNPGEHLVISHLTSTLLGSHLLILSLKSQRERHISFVPSIFSLTK